MKQHWAVDEEAAQGLEQLKTELRAKFSANLFEASAVAWKGDDLPSTGQPYQMISEDHIGSLPADLEDVPAAFGGWLRAQEPV